MATGTRRESDEAGAAKQADMARRRPAPTGPPLLHLGFRPFFLLAGGWGVLAMAVWLAVLAGRIDLPSRFDPVAWHAHEMIFGYGMAAVAGFLLTAIPNWTGRLPVRGGPLACLAALWLLGRAAVLFSDRLSAPLAAALDLAFPSVFLAVIAREIVFGRNRRNLLMVGLLALLLAGNLLVHVSFVADTETAALGERLGLATLLFLIVLVGGRITPSFSRNWLAKRNDPHLPRPFSAVDRVALVGTAGALLAWTLAPEAAATGWLCLAAGAALALRLSRWSGARTMAEPLLFVLHLAYGWLVLGLALFGLAVLTPAVPASTALHALTAGAVGTMTLAVMTRATLGHSGRPLTAGRSTVAIYLFVTAAALLRVLGPLFAEAGETLLVLSGLSWIAAFGLFVLFYGPILVNPRRPRS